MLIANRSSRVSSGIDFTNSYNKTLEHLAAGENADGTWTDNYCIVDPVPEDSTRIRNALEKLVEDRVFGGRPRRW